MRNMEVSDGRLSDAKLEIQGTCLMRSLQDGGRYGQSIDKPTSLYYQPEASDPLPISNSDSSSMHE